MYQPFHFGELACNVESTILKSAVPLPIDFRHITLKYLLQNYMYATVGVVNRVRKKRLGSHSELVGMYFTLEKSYSTVLYVRSMYR